MEMTALEKRWAEEAVEKAAFEAALAEAAKIEEAEEAESFNKVATALDLDFLKFEELEIDYLEIEED